MRRLPFVLLLALAGCEVYDYSGNDHTTVVPDAYVPDDSGLDAMEPLMTPLVTMTAFDLGQDRLPCFASYRFLYERLIGASVRPWLPGAFCAAAALPHLHPDRRRTLLQSISEAAATAPGWSNREPVFYPEWVEKVDPALAG